MNKELLQLTKEKKIWAKHLSDFSLEKMGRKQPQMVREVCVVVVDSEGKLHN